MKHGWLLLPIIAAAGGVAHADELMATLSEPIAEIAHSVDVRVADGVAIYKVQRQFRNEGKRAEEASLAIDLPAGAAATGLRIKARDRWYDGDLLEREKAAALYQKLTGLGAWQPKDPALLQWVWADKLHLQVFPVMPGQVSTVEYTLTVPTRYIGGRYWISYPRVAAGPNGTPGSRPLVAPQVSVRTAWEAGEIMVDGKPVASGATVALAPPPQPHLPDMDPKASYGVSNLVVPASSHTTRKLRRLELSMDISHTYNSDLVIELFTPQGKRVVLRDHEGGTDNGFHEVRPVELPEGTTGAGTWRLVVSDHAALDTGAIDRWGIRFGQGNDATSATATDTPVFVPDAPETANDAGVAAIAIAAPRIDIWVARLGRVVASKARGFSRLEVDVAPQVSLLPKRAQLVFVVDASWSIGEAQMKAQLDVIRAYLTHVPDAEVEIITARRRATRRFGRFVTAKQAVASLAETAAFARGNGSALDDAAALAAQALADRSGPRRLVILSDEQWRAALSPDKALASLAKLAPDAVVHVVVPRADGDDRVTLEKPDDATFGAMATAHHGIHVRLRGVPAPVERLAPVVLELVRPVRIDDVSINNEPIDSLKEGEGLRRFDLIAAPPSAIALVGRLWSDPIRLQVAAQESFSKQSAALVFGADAHQELTKEEMMTVARYGAAVSPVTSYVAAEPGTRPSTIGIAREQGGVAGGVASGMVGGSLAGTSTHEERPDPSALIKTAACEQQLKPAKGWRVQFDLETTRDEIVDVIAPKPDAMTACLVEAAWNVRLDAHYRHARDAFHIELRGR